MKKILLLILAVILSSCESPEKVDWDKLLGGSDKDSELTDTDSGNTGDDEDTGNSGNSGDDGDAGNSGNTAPDHDLDVSDTGDTGDGDTDSAFDDESDEDADLITDEDIVSPFCGDKNINEGEECDDGNKINTDACKNDCTFNFCGDTYIYATLEICDSNSASCSSIGIGTSGTAECRGDCSGWVTEGVCQRTFACSDKPLNSSWNTVSEYIQTWNGAAWSPVDSVTSYNLTPSSTQCRFKCDTNYTWNSGSGQCVPDTRIQSCGGLPANASWNTASSITQTWNGSAWIPTSTGTYNTVSSAEECRYICATNYTWNSGSSICVADTRTFTCADKPSANTEWNTVSNYTQTWNGTAWAPADSSTIYNATASTTSCRYKCSTDFYWNGSFCVSGSTTGTICTGQTKCYNDTVEITCPAEGSAFYGQDVQYVSECIPRSYTVNGTSGSDVVTDNNTGLIWQRTLSSNTYTWQGAINYCDGLNYAGQTDWRVPTRKELATLPDYGRSNPAIDTTIFPGTQSSSYWSSSSYVNYTINAWYVYFNYGYVNHRDKTYISSSYARCVRGSALPESSFTESTVSGKVIVTDTTTDLIWQKEYNSSTTWVNALSYCETSTYAGYADWRLPNIEELKTLIDDSKYNPASSFPGMPSNYFWSSSSRVSSTVRAWYVDFGNGEVAYNYKTFNYYARCVR